MAELQRPLVSRFTTQGPELGLGQTEENKKE